MTVNRVLAEHRGLDEESINEIESLHAYLAKLMDGCVHLAFSDARKEEIHDVEYILQKLWGFPQDRGYHTWAPLYEFKCIWVGRKFLCRDTGQTITLDKSVYPKEFISFGNCFLDLGTRYYCRKGGNIIEICPECDAPVEGVHKMSCDTQYKLKDKDD